MKNKITNYFIILIGALFLFMGCEDQLEETPKSFLSPENLYKTQIDFDAAGIGLYGLLSPQNTSFMAWWGNVIPQVYEGFHSLSAAQPTVPHYFDGWLSLAHIQPGHAMSLRLYVSFYRLISNCNVLIEKAKEVENLDTDVYTGEAHFLRAWAYYTMINYYGDVPLSTGIPEDFEPLPRTPRIDIINNVIIPDLKIAEEQLPLFGNGGGFPDNGRVTKGAAKSLLAEVYMMLSGDEFNIDHWTDAANKLKEIVDVSNPAQAKSPFQYHLENDYQNLWFQNGSANGKLGTVGQITKAAIEFGPESIWEINAEPTANNAAPKWIGIDAIDFIHQWWLDNVFDARDYRADVICDTLVNGPIYEDKMPSVYKSWNDSPINLIMYRYADILLMLAEAENEANGPTQIALGAINAVRARARNGNGTKTYTYPADLTNTLTKDQLRDSIRNERFIELCEEGQLFFDMRRWGTLQSHVEATSYPGNREWSERERFRPIPTSIVIATGVEQNPGW